MTPPREPDRYEEKAREAWNVWRLDRLIANEPNEITAAKITARVAAALRAAEASALERAAQVAKQSQDDCFCKDKADEVTGGIPCAACMEAARIEGTLHGLAHRLATSPEAPPAKAETHAFDPSWFNDISQSEYCEHCGKTRAEHPPPSEPVAPAPSEDSHPLSLRAEFEKYRKAEKRIAELEALLRGCRPLVTKAHVEANEGEEEGWFAFLRRIDAALSRTASPGKGEG